MKPVTRAVVLCVIATLAVTPVVAQDLVVPVTDTLWATIWSQVLIAVMPIVAGLIGYGLIEVRKLLRRLLGARADLAVNQSYEIMLRAGAGMLRAKVAQAGGTAAVERDGGGERRREDTGCLLAALRARGRRRGGPERKGHLEHGAVAAASEIISSHAHSLPAGRRRRRVPRQGGALRRVSRRAVGPGVRRAIRLARSRTDGSGSRDRRGWATSASAGTSGSS